MQSEPDNNDSNESRTLLPGIRRLKPTLMPRKMEELVEYSEDKDDEEDEEDKKESDLPTNSRVVACALCSCMFQQEALHAHMRQRHKDELIECAQCTQFFYNKQMLEKHFDEEHSAPIVSNSQKRKRKRPSKITKESTENVSDSEICDVNDSNCSRSGSKCPFCNDFFPNNMALKVHITTHFAPKAYACEECSEEFTDKDDLIRHKDNHKTGDQKFASSNAVTSVADIESWHCSVCNERFQTITELTRHQILHHSTPEQLDEAYRCSYCDFVSTSFHAITEHSKLHPKYFCGICDLSFESEDLLASHSSAEHPGQLECPECPARCRSNSELERHLNMHDSLTRIDQANTQLVKVAGLRPVCKRCEITFDSFELLGEHEETDEHLACFYTCEFCTKQFTYRKGLNEHKTKVHGEAPKRHCRFPSCTAVFNSQNELNNHRRSQHADQQRYPCLLCDKSFPFPARLAEHLPTHDKEKRYECEICARKFRFRRVLHAHIKNKHTISVKEEKPQKEELCEQCGKTYPSKLSLERHMTLHKIGHIRDFQCTDCPKSFISKNRLQNHWNEVHGPSKFICEFCSMGFKRRRSYEEHVRRHTGEKPLNCEDCGQAFRTKTLLVRHMRHHRTNMVKSLSCPDCGRIFTFHATLIHHMFNHTGEKPYKCSFCFKRFDQSANARRHVDLHVKKGNEATVLDEEPTGQYICEVEHCRKSFDWLAKLQVHAHCVHGTSGPVTEIEMNNDPQSEPIGHLQMNDETENEPIDEQQIDNCLENEPINELQMDDDGENEPSSELQTDNDTEIDEPISESDVDHDNDNKPISESDVDHDYDNKPISGLEIDTDYMGEPISG